MPADSEELALRYLLELSTDIRSALLLDPSGELVAAAPERPGDESLARCAALAREAESLGNGGGDRPVELDVTLPEGSVFLACEEERSLVCVTGRFALPGLILHDMRMVLEDLRHGPAPEPAQ